MTEVLILGMLVALVKLAHIASVVPGIALWSFGALMLLLAAASSLRSIRANSGSACALAGAPAAMPASTSSPSRAHGLRVRPVRLPRLRPAVEARRARPRRCAARAAARICTLRKPDSIARTWAFLIAAMVLYIPANVLPVMNTSSLFGAQKDTILSGVVYLWTSGSWPLAVIVFIASIAVPMLKIIALDVPRRLDAAALALAAAAADAHLPDGRTRRALVDARHLRRSPCSSRSCSSTRSRRSRPGRPRLRSARSSC